MNSVRYTPNSPKGGSQTRNGRFPSKRALLSKEDCYKVSLRENRQQQTHSYFGLSIRAKIVGRRRLLLRESLAESGPPHLKTPISNQYSLTYLAKSSINTSRKSTTSFTMSLKVNSVRCP